MSSKTRVAKQIATVLDRLQTQANSQGAVFSAESISAVTNDPVQMGRFESDAQHIVRDVAEILSEELNDDSLSVEDNESLRAGMIAFAASSSPSAAAEYNRRALSVAKVQGQFSIESIASGIGGEIVLADSDFSAESYDTTQLANFQIQNVVYNILASKQDAFGEAFFPTKVITPGEGGITITVDQQQVISPAEHPVNGKPLKLGRRNLLDAFQDHEVLNNPATELVPFYRGPEVDKFFLDGAGTMNRQIAGHTVATRPLLIGENINLLGLSQHPGLMQNGVLDQTDQIAPGLRVSNVYISLTDATDPQAPVTQIVKVSLKGMPRTEFRKSHEGAGREVVLNFPAKTLPLDANTKAVDGVFPSLLTTQVVTANITAQLSVSISGNGNLEEGNISVNASKLNVERAFVGGDEISLEEGAGEALVDRLAALSATVVGYDVEGRRSNSNFRTTGSLIDVTPYTESYAIQPGYPISVLSPPADDNLHQGSKISGMVNAARIRNSNNAVTTILNYAERLGEYKAAMEAGASVEIIGAGRHIVKPFFSEETIDVLARVNNLSSFERADDISSVLVDEVRDTAWRMFYESNYGPALELANAGTEAKATVIIGCDPVVARWLTIKGDERLVGHGMDYKVVVTNDKRMKGKITMSFTRGRPGSEDGLSFGVFAYMPELVQQLNVTRGNATSKNDRVVPRNLHVPVLPVMAMLSVVNLEEAVNNL